MIALALSFAGVTPLLVLGAGAALALPTVMVRGGQVGVFALSTASTGGLSATVAPIGLWPIFLVFIKIGAMVFGSGYVLLAFLHADLVEHLGWLTQQQLLDAEAVGQITPGPVFTTATFLGYLLHGPGGAVAATVGIFVPAFTFVAVSAPFIPKMRGSKMAGAALDGINVASLALMAVVSWQLGRVALVDCFTVAIAVLSLALLLRLPRLNSAWLIVGAGMVGALRFVYS